LQPNWLPKGASGMKRRLLAIGDGQPAAECLRHQM
jgi:hypothetical protein